MNEMHWTEAYELCYRLTPIFCYKYEVMSRSSSFLRKSLGLLIMQIHVSYVTYSILPQRQTLSPKAANSLMASHGPYFPTQDFSLTILYNMS
jgi:hypothetical protein